MDLNQKNIVVIVAGGIAAYKSADLVSRLRKAGAQTRVVMTRAATEFVAPLTFESLSGQPVYQDVFERPTAFEMEHIAWARWADAVVVAPATANLLAKMALGLADDAASTLTLAYQGPLWVAPAMNTAMLTHPATRQNLETLRARGVRVIEPGDGRLACGEVGAGRMAEPALIVDTLIAHFAGLPDNRPVMASGDVKTNGEGTGQTGNGATPVEGTPDQRDAPLAGKTVLITSGPTREMLDPIRFISNRSSGQMGAALAAEALARGARVIFVHGPMAAPVPAGVIAVPVTGARDMLAAVQRAWAGVDIAIFAAAVANYEAGDAAENKIKGGETLTLTLRRTPDIAAWCGANRRAGQLLIAFCAESEDLLGAAARKLTAKQCDLICANQIGEAGIAFEAGENKVTILTREGDEFPSPRMPKREVAQWIWDVALGRKDTRASSSV